MVENPPASAVTAAVMPNIFISDLYDSDASGSHRQVTLQGLAFHHASYYKTKDQLSRSAKHTAAV